MAKAPLPREQHKDETGINLLWGADDEFSLPQETRRLGEEGRRAFSSSEEGIDKLWGTEGDEVPVTVKARGRHFAGSVQMAHTADYGRDTGLVGTDVSERQETGAMKDNARNASNRGRHFANADSTKPKTAKRSNIVSNVLIVVGVLLLVVAGLIYFNNQRNYNKIDETNERIAEYARLSDDGNEPPVVDWATLKAMNPDIVAWLQIPGTIVNYPVLIGPDNDYYLEHAPDGSDSIGGSVFLDFECQAPGLVDQQTIVYGHHMRNGSQFKPIADMDSQELFNGVGRVWYVTEQGTYDLAPLFLFYTTPEDTDVREFAFANDDDFHAYLGRYFAQAVTKRPDAEQILASAHHVLTLSTCNYYDDQGRTLLVCVPRYEIPGTPEYDQFYGASTFVDPAAQEVAAQDAAVVEEATPAEGQVSE